MKARTAVAAFTAILATLALGAVPAQASIALGQTSDNSLGFFSTAASTEVETASEGALSYTVPAGGGVITSWSNRAESLDHGQIKLKIYRPSAEANPLTVIAESAPEAITPDRLNTYSTYIPVEAGDLLGMTRTAGTSASVFFFSMAPGDKLAQAQGADDPPGSSTTFAPAQPDARLDLSAVLRQQPGIGSIDLSSGPITGGTQVTIGGHDFTGASAVSFGSMPAASFTVNSDSSITAVSPPAPLGTVNLTVTTPLGTSPSVPVDQFTYTACLVPRLKDRSLKASKQRLRKANCRIGKVSKLKGASAKSDRVLGQRPRPGTVLALGSRVSVKLG
jgi:hypothetical protein